MTMSRRKKHFINSQVQGSLARRMLVHWLVFLVLTSLVALLLEVLLNPLRPIRAILESAWWTYGPMFLVMVFLLPVFLVDAIRLSNRFAGPIYSLRRAMRDIVQGKPARKLRFRRQDFWQELAEDYNALLLRLDLLEDEELSAAEDEELVASTR